MKTKWDKSGRFLTLSLKILISWFLKPLRHLLMKDIYKKRFSNVRFFGKNKPCTNCGGWNGTTTEYGHPERAFFRKPQTFGLGQTNWAENFGGIWGIFGRFIGTHFGTVSPLFMFSIYQPLFRLPIFLHKTKPFFFFFFEFGPQINRDLTFVCP